MSRDAWWRTSWKRAGWILLTLFISLWLLELIAAHTILWHEAREVGQEYPVVALMPKPLADRSMVELKDGATISRFGYSVQFPWPKTTVVRDWKTIWMTKFEGGPSLIIEDPADHFDMLRAAPEDDTARRNGLRPILGDEATRSHYDYAKAELNANPEDVSFFASRRNNARALMLLNMKFVEVPKDSTAIFEVAAPGIKGFQFGDPQRVPTSIELLLFDEHDRALKLVFRGPKDTNTPMLTQGQINSIVASVKVAAQ